MIGGEFQSIIDTSDESRLNDMDFFSISRKYRNINIIATQSVASLSAKGGAEAVSSLLVNCMTKIILQTSDPETEAWVRSMRGGAGASIRDLGRGECVFIVCPDEEGRLIDAEDSVNSEYWRIQDVIKGYQSPKHEERDRPVPPWRVGTAGFPYAISRVLTTPFFHPGLAAAGSYRRTAENMGRKYIQSSTKCVRCQGPGSPSGRHPRRVAERRRPPPPVEDLGPPGSKNMNGELLKKSSGSSHSVHALRRRMKKQVFASPAKIQVWAGQNGAEEGGENTQHPASCLPHSPDSAKKALLVPQQYFSRTCGNRDCTDNDKRHSRVVFNGTSRILRYMPVTMRY